MYKGNNKRMKKIVLFLLLFMPIIQDQDIFKLIPASIVNLILILLIIFYYTLLKKVKIKVNLSYLLFMSLMILVSLISKVINYGHFNDLNFIFASINIICFTLGAFFVITFISDVEFIKYYKFICIFLSAQIIFQYIYYYILGSRSNITLFGLNLFRDNLFSFYRPSALFSEPSHFSNYFSIIIFIELFINKNKKNAFLFTIINLLTTSNNGILLSSAIWVYYFIKKFDLKMIIVFTLSTLIIFNTNNILFSTVAERAINGGSISARVYRAFEIEKTMDWSQKILGVGLQNVSVYTSNNQIITKYDEENARYTEFMATFFYFFLASGIIGGIAFIILILMLLLFSEERYRFIGIMFLILCLTSNMLTSYTWVLYIYLILLYNKKNKVYIIH